MNQGGGLSRDAMLPPGMLDMAIRRNSPGMQIAQAGGGQGSAPVRLPNGFTLPGEMVMAIMEEIRRRRAAGAAQQPESAPDAPAEPTSDPEQKRWGQDAVENEQGRQQMIQELMQE